MGPIGITVTVSVGITVLAGALGFSAEAQPSGPRAYIRRPGLVYRQPPVYIQREPYYWYYCPDPNGYYPHVPNCRQEWRRVVPGAPVP